MNLLDYALLLIVAISVGTAAVKGFAYEVWMMAATALAIGLAAWNYPAAAPWFGWIGAGEARDFAAFVAILLAVLVVAMVLGRMGRGMLHAVGLGWLDRLLGAGLGLVRGVVLGAAVVLMLTAYPLHGELGDAGLVRDSKLAPELMWGSRALALVMPATLEARFRAGLGRISKEWP